MNQVASLVFPPLVDSNFGSYYPSTAVLGAFLSANGINVSQRDLNEEFALYLLRHELLERMATGLFCNTQPLAGDSMAVVAARVLLRFRELLFDDQGRHLFRDRLGSPSYLLQYLSHPYRVDLPMSELVKPEFFQTPQSLFYESFFEWSGYAQDITRTVHTIGISVAMGPQLAPALVLARWLKKCRIDLSVVLGGPTLSLMQTSDLAALLKCHAAVDAIVRFDGEIPLLELLRQKEMGVWNPQQVPGVSSRVEGKTFHKPPQPGPQLKQLPYPKYDTRLMSQLADPEVGIIQARGCYWGKCSYCDYVELYDGSPPYRTRIPESFVNEMQFQKQKYGVNRFLIITESLPPAFARKMSQLILDARLEVKWHSFAMVDKRFDSELFSLMVRAGCDHLVVGLETMVDRVLKIVKKSATQAENIRFLQDAKASGLRIRVNLIPDLPSTTYDEAMASLTILRRLRHCIWGVSVFPFEATSSSAVGRSPGSFGLRTLNVVSEQGQAQFALNHLQVEDPAMSSRQRRAVWSAYRAFADETNGQDEKRNLSTKITDDLAYLQIAHDRLDFFNAGDFLFCYDWISRRKFRLHKGWKKVLTIVDAIAPFRKDDLSHHFPDSVADWLYKQLQSHGFLESIQVAEDLSQINVSYEHYVPALRLCHR